jgi:uncharacterized protein YgiM (DUF1202 family)
MKKKITFMLLLLALVAGLYVTAGAKGDRVPDPTSTAARIATAEACRVNTGVDAGTVNLRACGSVACGVLDIVTEGERLTIVTAGAWTQVTRADGVTGWVNSNYCKKEK